MKRIDILNNKTGDYKLLDCGNGRRLDAFGGLALDRPDPQAIWPKTKPDIWIEASASFGQKGKDGWKVSSSANKNIIVSFDKIKMNINLNNFKHVGIFPEHTLQWIDIQNISQKITGARMLNLFGYTGAASIAGALSGMKVTHVDASKQAISLMKENMKSSGLGPSSIRIVCEDATRYTKRLIERGEKFEVIVMDPPAFGRGPKGEVWKIEDSLTKLLVLIPQVLSENAKLVILNGYASGFSARVFGELLKTTLPDGDIEYGDIGILQSNSDRVLTTGIYSKWQK